MWPSGDRPIDQGDQGRRRGASDARDATERDDTRRLDGRTALSPSSEQLGERVSGVLEAPCARELSLALSLSFPPPHVE